MRSILRISNKKQATHPIAIGSGNSLPPSYIFIKSDKRIEKVELSDILYAEVLGNYVTIWTERKKIIAYLTMKSLESQLSDVDFIKIHQSFLVNRSKIESVEGNDLKVGTKSLPISRNYRDRVMGLINERLLKR